MDLKPETIPYLRDRAKQNNICGEWYEDILTKKSIGDLAQMYFDGIDFCLNCRYPTKEEFLRLFDKDSLNKVNIHIDNTIQLKNIKQAVFMGNCKGVIEQSGYIAGELYAVDQGDITIIAKGNAFTVIDAFDNVTLSIKAQDNARVCVNLYGNSRIISDSVQDNAYIKKVIKGTNIYK